MEGDKPQPLLQPTRPPTQLLAAIRAATSSLTSTTPAWRLSNPLPAAGAPPPGAQDALDAYIRHVAAEAADGRADEVALAVLDEGERGGGEPAWREGEEGGVRALPGAG